MKLFASVVAVAIVWMAWAASPVSFAGDGNNVQCRESSVSAKDGQTYGKLSTVNGDVHVGRGAIADEARTVNGSIHIKTDARLGSVGTVNGSIDIDEGVAVEREATTVNGDVEMSRRSRVGGDVTTVAGDIELEGAEWAANCTQRRHRTNRRRAWARRHPREEDRVSTGLPPMTR